MNRYSAHLADYCRFFTADDACRLALSAYYAASRSADVYAKAAQPSGARLCPPLAPDTAGDGAAAPSLPVIDRPWFLGEYMQALSDRLAKDNITRKAHAEIIARWEAEENAPKNAQFATSENRPDNANSERG